MMGEPTYEQLNPQEAARVDAVCDGFEQAWKAAHAGGTLPRLASFLSCCDGSERTVLLRELVALDRACRERYGLAVRPEDYQELGVAEGSGAADSCSVPRAIGGSVYPRANWPSLPGLELVEVLGSGGMGVVFKARQPTLGRDVAVKVLRDPHLGSSEQRERFRQEARAVAQLQHPHLVRLYEFGEVPGAGEAASQPYLVLEYVPGTSLAHLLRGSPQPPAEAAQLVETLADAIHYAHQQGVIHRDLKPANILLQKDEGGRMKDELRADDSSSPFILHPSSFILPKVTDFGLAKVLAGSDLTRTGDVLGTPSYMAPEQAAGKPGVITAAADVYGLGAILYEALTGRPPFQAETAVATLSQVLHEDPVPPRRLQPTVPRDLETICLKCLRKEAGRRYATAGELADDLRRFRTGEPIRARPAGTAERLVRWCRRKPALAGLLAALVVVFLAGLTGVLWQWRHARQNAAALEQERDTARREQERAENHLRLARRHVDHLTQVGRDLWQRPRLYHLGKDVLEEALTFYQEVLPAEGSNPELRREAADLYGQVAHIHHSLGRYGKAVEAFDHQARLLSTLLAQEPADKALGLGLARTIRWRGNALREMGKAREARAAYDEAAALHAQLLAASPGDAHCQVQLANTLLNKTTVLSPGEEAEELQRIFGRALRLQRDALDTEPENPHFKSELALGLEDQGLFFLATAQLSQAADAVRAALAIQQPLLADGRMPRGFENYVARNHANLGRVLAASGQTEAAERSYQEAVQLLEQSVKEYPDWPFGRVTLAQTLASLADLLKNTGRQRQAEEVRRRVVGHYETLTADFHEDPNNRRKLLQSYVKLGSARSELGRYGDAIDPYRKALELDPESAAANNELGWFLATCPESRWRDPAQAVRLAQKAVTASPEAGNYWNTLGVAHYRNGDAKAAVAALETSMRLRSGGDSFDWFFLAMAHSRLGDRDQARMWLHRAAQWMDQHPPPHDELGRFRAEATALVGEAGKP
jgi:tetratricopeptide (TPR) repeat protein